MKPERPAALDLLDAFVGEWVWSGQGELAGMDRPVRFSGRRESRWEGDRWYLVTRETGCMEGFGESHTLSVWSYDARAKLFRTAYVNSTGTTMSGLAQYDETTTTWKCRATSHGPSGTAAATGHIHFCDSDTMQWDWTEQATDNTKKTGMHLTGTCRRA